jgi:hypothetical protein
MLLRRPANEAQFEHTILPGDLEATTDGRGFSVGIFEKTINCTSGWNDSNSIPAASCDLSTRLQRAC